MARPKANPQDKVTRERLLVSAEHAFGAVGYTRARLEDIAKDAGISRPSLLYHFASKERLYEQVVRRVFNTLGELFLESIRGDGDFGVRLDRTVLQYEAFVRAHPDVARITVRELLDPTEFSAHIFREEVVPLLDEIERVLRKEAGGILGKDLPVRSVITQFGISVMLRVASGDLGRELFGDGAQTLQIVRALLIGAKEQTHGAHLHTAHR